MKKTIRLSILVAVMAMTAASCSIYHPQSVDIPLIDHKGDTRIDASLGMSYFVIPSTVTLNATATHGFSDWISGQVHANYGGNNYYVQAAPGVFKKVGPKCVFESFVGVGFGGAKSDDEVDAEYSTESTEFDYTYDGTYVLPFVQGNFGLRNLTPANIDIGFGLKMGAYIPDFKYAEPDNGFSYNYTTTNFLLEPQFIFRIGIKLVKFNFRIGYAWLSDINDNDKCNLYADPINASVGLTFSF